MSSYPELIEEHHTGAESQAALAGALQRFDFHHNECPAQFIPAGGVTSMHPFC